MVFKILLTLAIVCLTSEIASAATDKVVCYHGTWSTYRWGNGKFTVEDIDPTLCTHLIYSFVGINTDGTVKLLDAPLDINQGNFKRINALKQKNKNLKTLIAIGGWSEGSETFSTVAASATKRQTLIKSALNFLQTYEFDGFDLDWEYPAQRGGAAADKANFAILIKEFRAEFDKHGLLLTAAVAASPNSVDLSYDVPALSKYLDLINVMAYDLHGAWDGITGQNAPLYASSVDIARGTQQLTVEASIKGWIARGAEPQKLALGLGVYGRTYTLANSASTALGAPVVNGGNGGPFTQESGMLGYNEIVELQKQGGWTTVWDDQQKVPYSYKGNQWVGYDDPKSIAIKVEWAKSLNLGGVMIWSIETEDFRGISGTKYPILKTIQQSLGGQANENLDPEPAPQPNPEPEPQPNPEPEPKPETPPAPAPAPSGELCLAAGFVRDPVECNVFYYCLPLGTGKFSALKQTCQAGLVFDLQASACNWESLVSC